MPEHRAERLARNTCNARRMPSGVRVKFIARANQLMSRFIDDGHWTDSMGMWLPSRQTSKTSAREQYERTKTSLRLSPAVDCCFHQKATLLYSVEKWTHIRRSCWDKRCFVRRATFVALSLLGFCDFDSSIYSLAADEWATWSTFSPRHGPQMCAAADFTVCRSSNEYLMMAKWAGRDVVELFARIGYELVLSSVARIWGAGVHREPRRQRIPPRNKMTWN